MADTEQREPTIKLEDRRVADLIADPRNARHHSARNIDVIAASLRTFGQQKNVVVLPDGQLVAGSGTLAAAAKLAAMMPDPDDPKFDPNRWQWLTVSVFNGTMDEARKFALVDNRSAELATWDADELAEQLGGFDPDDIPDLGWAPEELDDILASITGPELDADETDEDGGPLFAGKVNQTGLTELKERYGAKTTRTLFFELDNDEFSWVVDRLSEQRKARSLDSNAAALVAILEQVSGVPYGRA